MTIYEALAAVNREIKAVGKNQTNAHFKYSFRGIDDVMNTLHPLLARHGVLLSADVEHCDFSSRVVAGFNGKEKLERLCEVRIRYRFYCEDGSHLESVGIGLGIDDSDKGYNKAQVQALKYMLLTLFTIPTEDMDEADACGDTAEAPASSTYQAEDAQKKLLAAYAKAAGVVDKKLWGVLSEKCIDVPMDDLKSTIEGLAKNLVQV